MVVLGQKVKRVPKTILAMMENRAKLVIRPMEGKVVFVHSKGRFHTVEFTNASGVKMRESFDGVGD